MKTMIFFFFDEFFLRILFVFSCCWSQGADLQVNEVILFAWHIFVTFGN